MNPVKSNWKFIVDFRMLSLLLLIALVPFLLGTLWLIGSYRSSYIKSQGCNLADQAEVSFNFLNNYLENQIINIAGLTEITILREAIEKSNLDLKTNADGTKKRTNVIQKRWPAMDYRSPELRAVLDNPASDFLRRYTAMNSPYREIIVTDLMARTVAATGKTSDYQHIQDSWWKEAYSDGHRGGVFVGDVHYHTSANTYCFDLAQPFVNPKGGVIGVIMVGIDAQEIHNLIGSLRTGFGGTAALIRTDGSIISAPDRDFLDKRPFSGMADLKIAADKGYAISQTKPQIIYGVSSRKFVDTYPHLTWILAVSSPVETLVGPLTNLLWHIVTLILAIMLMTILVAFWLSFTKSRPILEEDAHLERI
jgi:hypothetical protein